MLRLYRFGIVDLPIYDGSDSHNLTAPSGLVQIPNGAFDLHGGDLLLASRKIKRTFTLIDTDTQTITQQFDELFGEFAKGRLLLQGVTRDDEIRQTWAKARVVSDAWQPGDVGLQKVAVEFEMDYPYWITRADEPNYLNDGLQLDGSWTLSAGNIESEAISASPHNFVITNNGGVAVPKGWLQIKPQAAGSITNVKVENTTNGLWMQYVGTLGDTDTLEVEFLPKSVRLNNAPAFANFALSANQQEFMLLEVGANAISVTGTGLAGTIDLSWQWSRHFL